MSAFTAFARPNFNVQCSLGLKNDLPHQINHGTLFDYGAVTDVAAAAR